MPPDAELGEDNVRGAATRLAIAHIVDVVCPFFFVVGAASLIYARSMASGSSKLKKRGRGNTDMGVRRCGTEGRRWRWMVACRLSGSEVGWGEAALTPCTEAVASTVYGEALFGGNK
jgi:hypothetical protein